MEVFKLSDIAKFTTGKLNSNAAETGGKYPFFTCAPEPLRINTYAFDTEAIILAGNNAEGNFHIQYYEGKFNAYQRTYVIESCDASRVNLRYLYYALKMCLRHFKQISQGTATKFLTAKILNGFEVPIPTIELQNRIASLLGALDEKLEVNESINKNLEQQVQTLYNAWFVNFEPFNGEMPSDWIISKLGDIVSIKTNSFSPTQNPETQLEHYSIPAYDNQKYPVFEAASRVKSNKYILSPNSVMISKLNPETKRVWRPMCISKLAVSSTEFIIFEAFNPAYKDFVFSIIDSSGFSDWMCAHTTGSTNSRQRTTPSATLEFQVVLPNEKTITDFCAIVTPMYDSIAANICENQKLTQLRDAILPKLMSGELDVSDIDC